MWRLPLPLHTPLVIELSNYKEAWRLVSLESSEAEATRTLQSKAWNWHNVTSAHFINYKTSPNSKRMIEIDPSPLCERISFTYRKEGNQWQPSLETISHNGIRGRKKWSQVPQLQRKSLGFRLLIEVNYWTLFYGWRSSTHRGNCSISATRQNIFYSAIDFSSNSLRA